MHKEKYGSFRIKQNKIIDVQHWDENNSSVMAGNKSSVPDVNALRSRFSSVIVNK